MNPRLFIQGVLHSGAGRESLGRKALLFPLFLLSLLYALIMRWRRGLYRRGILPSSALPCPVVSVGNITLGGTGKTPMVIYLAQLLQQRGLRAAVLSRGYRSQSRDAVAVVSDGTRVLLGAREAGDEPAMLAQALPGTPVIIGRDRVRSGSLACARFSPDVILLDDGFQHLRLRRNADIVLVDRNVGFGNGCLIPRGILREPLSALQAADLIVLTKKTGESRPHPAEGLIVARNPRAPLFSAGYAVRGLTALDGSPAGDLQGLAGKNVLAVAGIGNPGYFTHLLRSSGIRVTEEMLLPDHHCYTAADAERLAACASRVDCIITTAKDGCKMAGAGFHHLPVLVLDIMVEMDDEAAFIDALLQHIPQRDH
jgi:tetraacyldisaccharide 4'-kinase